MAGWHADSVGQRDGASEPEEGGHSQQAKCDDAMVGSGEEARGESKVEKDENRPDATEEHKTK